MRDFAEVKADGNITAKVADAALAMLDVDPVGFDLMDRKLLEAILHKFDGGPVGVDQSCCGDRRRARHDRRRARAPYLIQQGFLQRTPRGRVATLLAYRHFGLAAPDLFEPGARSVGFGSSGLGRKRPRRSGGHVERE